MLIWSGRGYLVPVFVFCISLFMEIVTESTFQDDGFYQREAWPLALALTLAGFLCIVFGQAMRDRGGRR